MESGIPHILKAYPKECFKFTDNFLEICFPYEEEYLKTSTQTTEYLTQQDKYNINKELSEDNREFTPQVAHQVTPQVRKLIMALENEMSRSEIQKKLKLTDRVSFIERYIKPAITLEIVEMTIPEKPKSRLQKYRLTAKGLEIKKQNENKGEEINRK